MVANGSDGWKIEVKNPEFEFKSKGDVLDKEIVITRGNASKNSKPDIYIKIENEFFNYRIKRADYDHIPSQFILSPAQIGLINAEVVKNKTSIAYIPGAGDEVAVCLQQIGYNVTVLTGDILLKEDLSKYSAIITGIRA